MLNAKKEKKLFAFKSNFCHFLIADEQNEERQWKITHGSLRLSAAPEKRGPRINKAYLW